MKKNTWKNLEFCESRKIGTLKTINVVVPYAGPPLIPI